MKKLFTASDFKSLDHDCIEYDAMNIANKKTAALMAEIAELEAANADCISLNLHESRLKNASDQVARLKEQVEDLQWFVNKVNRYVIPGERDTQESVEHLIRNSIPRADVDECEK